MGKKKEHRNLIRLAIVAAVLFGVVVAAFYPGVRYRATVLARKLRGETPLASWSQIAVVMAPSPLRPLLRNLMSETPTLPQWIETLNFPADIDTPHKEYTIFNGPTATMKSLDCHFSVLRAGETPHPPHQHPEEELIVPLEGALEVIRVDPEDSSKRTTEEIGRRQFVFHAANHPHTLRAPGPGPSTYLVLKWSGRSMNLADASLRSSTYDARQALLAMPTRGYETASLFESGTAQLGKLQAHVGRMLPGAGYDPHRDGYDVAIIVFDGAVETLGQRVGPRSVIFYPADLPHGMKNAGDEPTHYLVFEFHGAVSR